MEKKKKDLIEFHTGFITEEAGDNQRHTKCPFCGKDEKLYYGIKDDGLLWDCKVCQRKGNQYTFINLLYEQICKVTFEVPNKGITYSHYNTAGVRFNPLTENLVFPTFNNDGKMNNLYKYVELMNTWMSSPKCAHGLLNNKEALEDTVWVMEGHFDTIAGIAIVGVTRPVSIIGVPGAGVFKDDWLQRLKGRDVVLFPDNDAAGAGMVEGIMEAIKNSPIKPKSLNVVEWGTAPVGFDTRDFYNEHKGKSYKLLEKMIEPILEKNLTTVTASNIIEDFSCDSYAKAVDIFANTFYMTQDMKMVLPAVMASIYSVNIPGEQVWLRVIGAPSSGKTRIARAISASDQVVSRSTFTGLFSGWADDKDDDPGLIPIIAGRTLVVKDADALLRQPNIERIMSELRDFFDKSSTVQYRNRKQYNYENVRSTFILMGTNVLRRADHSYLGERFLTMEMNTNAAEETLITDTAYDNSISLALGQVEEPEDKIMSAMKGWINHLMQMKVDFQVDNDMKQEILRMAWIAAKMRTQVDRNMRGEIASPPVPELPPRLVKQMVAAVVSMSVVFQVNRPTEDIYRVISKITKDVIDEKSVRFQICQWLMENPDQSATSMVEGTGFSRTTIQRELDDLRALNFIRETKISISGNRPGAKVRAFGLDKSIMDGLTTLR